MVDIIIKIKKAAGLDDFQIWLIGALDRAEDHPMKINLPEYDKADKETDDKTLDQKAQEEREY